MKKAIVSIMLAAMVAGTIVCAQNQPQPQPQPQTEVGPKLPGRTPMASHLLTPSAEWNAYYDVVPEGERSLYYTTKVLLEAVRAQQKQIAALQKQIAALQPKETSDATDPEGPQDQAGHAEDVWQNQG